MERISCVAKSPQIVSHKQDSQCVGGYVNLNHNLKMWNKMNTPLPPKKYPTAGTVQIFNTEILETEAKSKPLIHILHFLLPCLGTCTSKKCGGIKLA